MTTPVKTKRNFLIPIILLMIFAGPMVAAYSLYSAKNPWIEETINYGQLIDPALNFSQLKLISADEESAHSSDLAGQWLMLYVSSAPCTALCQKNLYYMRQVWVALGKDMDRVQRVIVTSSPQTSPELKKLLSQNYVGTEHFIASPQTLTDFFGKTSGALYLVDPHSNVMMVYPENLDAEGLLADLKRLLNVSQIG